MASLNLGQDVANKRDGKIDIASHIVAKSYPPIASRKNASFSY